MILYQEPCFTSDHHFFHDNIIIYSKRPFKNVWEMNEVLIEKWNAKVKPGQDVYHNGDIFLKCTVEQAWALRKRLNGNIHVVWGNHEKVAKAMPGAWAWGKDYYELYLHNRPMIVLSHYAFRVWNKSHHGSWHLYGHSHGSLPDDPNALSFDVGVDCHNFEPLTWEEVKARMDKKDFKPVDHHTGRKRGARKNHYATNL